MKTKKSLIFFNLVLIVSLVFIFWKVMERKTVDGNGTLPSSTENSETIDSASIPSNQNIEDDLPNVSLDDWDLLLVNESNVLPTDFEVELATMADGYELDARIESSYSELIAPANEAGHELVSVSAYRSVSYQQQVYDNSINDRVSQGMTQEEAEEETAEYVMKPGTSEHHTGLAIDVLEKEYYAAGGELSDDFAETEAAKWLAENACHYGFIIRYLEDKVDITGINYEPWHIRYVGKENAEYMVNNNLALEEYLNILEKAGK